jgi:DNA-directed RNA polymerase beta' subunit
MKELLSLPKTRQRCKCPNSIPTIKKVEEVKQEESEQEYEWKAGRKKKKPASRLILPEKTVNVRELLRKVDLSSLGVDKELIMNLFFHEMILLPICNHPMAFRRGLMAGVEEFTGISEVYQNLYNNAIDRDIKGIQEIQRTLMVASANEKYKDAPSHVVMNDGKKGLYRGPALNKRCIGTGRAVLTLNNGRSGEITCPSFITSNLYREYIVSIHNKDWLQKKAGTSVSHIVVPIESSLTNDRKTYKKISAKTILKFGDIVLKTIEDGDHVIFLRHPTLHRGSLTGYRVKIWKNFCIGLHETNMPGHNADLDGDEGNVQVGANLATRIESQMMDSFYQLFGGRSGEPAIGIVYNGPVGAYVLSTDNDIPPRTFQILKAKIENNEGGDYITEISIDENHYRRMASKFGIPYYSGRTLISMLLPRALNYTRDDVKIREGFMIAGRLNSSDVANELITAIAIIDRWRAPYLFVDRGYAMMSAYVSTKGLTISARDYVMPGELRKQVIPISFQERLLGLEAEVKRLERNKDQKTKASVNRLEEQISLRIGELANSVSDLLKKGEYKETDLAKISYGSGARGSIGNVSSVTTFVGQMYTGSERLGQNVPRLSYYSDPSSISIFDRGFIRNSYTDGLSPKEVVALAGPARKQAFETYLGVPTSGHESRQTVFHEAGVHVTATLSTHDRNDEPLDCLYGYGCDCTMVTYRKGPLGNIESPVDALKLLDLINS